MKKQAKVSIVLALSLVVVGTVCYLSSHPLHPGGLKTRVEPVAQAASPAVTESSLGVTPNLSQVDAYKFLDLLPVGHKVPLFNTQDVAGRPIKMVSYLGKKNVVLVFYQGSFCGHCGHQLDNIQRHFKDYQAQDAQILAISADDKAHAMQTLGEHGLSFPVIPDTKKALIKQFGVGNIGRQGIAWPSAYIIDKKGLIRLSYADHEGKRIHSDGLLPVLSKITGKPVPKLGYED